MGINSLFLRILGAEAWLCFQSWRMDGVSSTAVDTCLLSSRTKKVSSSRATVRQGFCPLKGSTSVLQAAQLWVQTNCLYSIHLAFPHLPTSVTFMLLKLNQCTWIVLDPGGLCLLPASTKLPAGQSVTLQVDNISDPFTVLVNGLFEFYNVRFLKILLIDLFWRCWVFIAARRLSLLAAAGLLRRGVCASSHCGASCRACSVSCAAQASCLRHASFPDQRGESLCPPALARFHSCTAREVLFEYEDRVYSSGSALGKLALRWIHRWETEEKGKNSSQGVQTGEVTYHPCRSGEERPVWSSRQWINSHMRLPDPALLLFPIWHWPSPKRAAIGGIQLNPKPRGWELWQPCTPTDRQMGLSTIEKEGCKKSGYRPPPWAQHLNQGIKHMTIFSQVKFVKSRQGSKWQKKPALNLQSRPPWEQRGLTRELLF